MHCSLTHPNTHNFLNCTFHSFSLYLFLSLSLSLSFSLFLALSVSLFRYLSLSVSQSFSVTPLNSVEWNAAFERQNGRPPTNPERKALARGMYENYQRVRSHKYNISFLHISWEVLSVILISIFCFILFIFFTFFTFFTILPSQISNFLKARCDKVNNILETVGLTHHGFLKLRDKYFEWQENTQPQEESEIVNEN